MQWLPAALYCFLREPFTVHRECLFPMPQLKSYPISLTILVKWFGWDSPLPFQTEPMHSLFPKFPADNISFGHFRPYKKSQKGDIYGGYYEKS